MSNILSIIRLIGTIPLIIIINKYGANIYSFIFFIILSITDFLDGYIARKTNTITDFGKIIDGVADKFLMIGITIILLYKKVLPLYTLIIFIRDISSCIYAIYYMKRKNIILKSNIFGKSKTVLHIICISLTLLLGEWTIYSNILFIIAILLFIPEILYIKKTR